MPFGMKNAPATFQRMIHRVIADLEEVEGYIDDIIIFSSTWEQHLQRVKAFLNRLRQAQLTVNLAKNKLARRASLIWDMLLVRGRSNPFRPR